VRNPIRSLRARALALCMMGSFAATPVAAAADVYDKYRGVTYSNDGLASEQDEVRLGYQVHEQVLQKYRLVQDREITGYVEQLGERIARASVRPDLNYHFFVVEDQSLNAFSLPGGYVYVNTGILGLAQSEDELAAVLAHETAHIAARHGLRNLKRAQRAQIGVGIASILGQILTRGGAGGRAIGAGAQILGAGVLTKYSRDFEREADYLGLYNLTRAGYQPAGMVRIFERLGQAQGRAQSSIGGIFASHPDAGERIRNTELEIEQHLGNQYGRGSSVGDPVDASEARYQRRRRRAGTDYGNSAFGEMKQALASYRPGRRGESRDPRILRRDRSDQRGQSESYDPPPLRRRPAQP
jgi:predicted Zn-dependent protease